MSRQLLKSAGKVSSMTMLSRLLGLARDVVFAHAFGAAAGFDAFLLAFRLPNFMRALFAEGAFSQAFVPVLVQYQQQQSAELGVQFLNRTLAALWSCVCLIVLLGVCFAPLLVMVFAPGFVSDPQRFDLASTLLRITFPYLFLISTASFFAAILNTHERFMLPAFVPCLLNMALIWAALVWRNWDPPVSALAWGVMLGGVLQALTLAIALLKRKLLPRPAMGFWQDQGVRQVATLMLPAIFGVSVTQISLLISTMFASFLPIGSLSWLYYSERLVYLPVGVFGVALATVITPSLARAHVNKTHDQYQDCLDWALRTVMLVALPAAVGVAMLAAPLLISLFHYGVFSMHDVWMARKSLLAYSMGIPAFMLIKVLASAFYAQQNIRSPVKVAAVAVLLNIVLNALLIGPFLHAGLALASTVSAWFNVLGLLFMAYRLGIYVMTRGWLVFTARCVCALVAMAVVLIYVTPSALVWQAWDLQHRVCMLLAMVMAGALVYGSALWCVGLRWHQWRRHA